MTADLQFYGRHSAVDDVCHRTDVTCHVEQFKHPDRPLPVTPTRHALVVVAS